MFGGKTLNVGVIGTGMGRLHISDYCKVPGVKVLAVCDLNEKELNEQADRFDVPLRFTDYRKLLAVEELDAVSVVVPNDLHKEMTLAALDRGLHVLCEKPMATNADDAAEMVAAAGRAGRRLMIHMVLRFRGEYVAMKRLAESGRLGDIYCAEAAMIRRRSVPALHFAGDAIMGRGEWFVTAARSGGGALMDIGVHILDLAWWLMGCPRPLAVVGNTFLKIAPDLFAEKGIAIDVDEMVTAQITCEGGRMLHFTAAWCCNMKKGRSLRLFGTRAGISAMPPMLHYNEGDKQVDEPIDPPAENSSCTAQQHFVECIRDPERPLIASGEECLPVARMLDAVKESARTGHEVVLDAGGLSGATGP